MFTTKIKYVIMFCFVLFFVACGTVEKFTEKQNKHDFNLFVGTFNDFESLRPDEVKEFYSRNNGPETFFYTTGRVLSIPLDIPIDVISLPMDIYWIATKDNK